MKRPTRTPSELLGKRMPRPLDVFRIWNSGHRFHASRVWVGRCYQLAGESGTRLVARAHVALSIVLGGFAPIAPLSRLTDRLQRTDLADVVGPACSGANRMLDDPALQTHDPGYLVVLVTDIVGSTSLSIEFGDRPITP